MPPRSESDADTKQRLLTAAVQVFADKGYKSATVSDICTQAGANRAAINYHYTGKDELYLAAVRYAYEKCGAKDVDFVWPAGTPALVRLRDFIRETTRSHLTAPHPAAIQLMMREMLQPTTPACAEWVHHFIRPMAEVLHGILTELMPTASFLERYRMGFSIVAQSLFYRQNREIVTHLVGAEQVQHFYDADALAEHIYTLVLRGLKLEPIGGQS
jgi:AcrR family transcriptional regulator